MDALWLDGDVTVATACDSLVGAARKGRIPVFSVLPPQVKSGTLFDLGADYREVGRLAGKLAGDVLNGRSPATVPIENVMPEMLTLNRRALAGLKGTWKIPAGMAEKADLVIDERGAEHAKTAPRAAPAAPSVRRCPAAPTASPSPPISRPSPAWRAASAGCSTA